VPLHSEDVAFAAHSAASDSSGVAHKIKYPYVPPPRRSFLSSKRQMQYVGQHRDELVCPVTKVGRPRLSSYDPTSTLAGQNQPLNFSIQDYEAVQAILQPSPNFSILHQLLHSVPELASRSRPNANLLDKSIEPPWSLVTSIRCRPTKSITHTSLQTQLPTTAFSQTESKGSIAFMRAEVKYNPPNHSNIIATVLPFGANCGHRGRVFNELSWLALGYELRKI